MRTLKVIGLLLCSSVRAAPVPGSGDAGALSQCLETMRAFDAVRSFPALEPDKSERRDKVRALLERTRRAPGMYIRESSEVRGFARSLAPHATMALTVLPLDRLSVVQDCGEDAVLVALWFEGQGERQGEGEGYFETAFARRGDLQGEPPSCGALTDWVGRSPYRVEARREEDERPLYVTEASVLIREGPGIGHAPVELLTVGARVVSRSEACGDWLLVSTRHGLGFVPRGALRERPLDEAELASKMESEPAKQTKGLWAVARASAFPSEENLRVAAEWMQRTRPASPADRASPADTASPADAAGRCETFFGACDVLQKESLSGTGHPVVAPGVELVPLGPWWVLPENNAPAQPALLRSAWVYSSGECNCCACESCQTTLELDFEIMGAPGVATVLGATRDPPASWFRQAATESCAQAERIARSSARWEAPLQVSGPPTVPARMMSGTCFPGDDGTVWWEQSWAGQAAGEEDLSMFRSYQIADGRVIAVGELHVIAIDTGPLGAREAVGWSSMPLVAWRDLDGDGRSERLMRCRYGRICTDQNVKAREEVE